MEIVYQENFAMPKTVNNPVFSIVFSKGTADQHRLPLAHVLESLTEIATMIREVGIQVQRANGVENPDGDFGIELLAGEKGGAFYASSVMARAAVTRDVKNGLVTLGKIFAVTDTVEKKTVRSVDSFGEPVLRRLAIVGRIQEKDNTELKMQLVSSRGKPKETKFSAKGIETLRAMSAAELAIEAVTLYGKLQRLSDYSNDDEGQFFWGHLKEDSGKIWRIRFKTSELSKVQKLFTKQVIIAGDATYFKTRSPRVYVSDIREEKGKDYLAAMERFQKNYGPVFKKASSQDIMNELRG
jgi:hypothetical protein